MVKKLPDWLERGLTHPVAVAGVLSLGIKLGQESTRLRAGEISKEEFRKRAGRHLGAVTGTMSGAGVGSLLGRLWPGPGTLVGIFVGSMLGEMWGEKVGRNAVERFAHAWASAAKDSDPTTENDGSDPAKTMEDVVQRSVRRRL